MHMGERLSDMGLSKYRLSKNTGIPYMTLNDICSGKTKLQNCTAETVYRLAKAMDTTMEELLESVWKEDAAMQEQRDFELFKSNVCHRVKTMGDLPFVVETLRSDEIRRYYDKAWYPEALYLLAMVDYLSRENDLPLCMNYNDIRAQKLKTVAYPSGILALYAATRDKRCKEESLRAAIPEFRRFNIVENEVRNVL